MTEAEQLEAIKAWWLRHQRWISIVLSMVLILLAGYRFWIWRAEKITHLASTAYEQLMIATSNHEDDSIEAYANNIITEYPKTIYADAARLLLARYWVSKSRFEDAIQALSYVADHGKMPALQQIAGIRLARIWIAEKAYDQALAHLEKIKSDTYQPLIDELKADIYAATGQYDKADRLYRAANEAVQARGISHVFLDMKAHQLAIITNHARSV